MGKAKHRIRIKGVRDELIFLLHDRCDFDELLQELQLKLETTHQHILSGPVVHVRIRLGKRTLTTNQETALRDVFKTRGNLFIKAIESSPKKPSSTKGRNLHILGGMVRSGQTVQHEGDLLYIGDVNPGGTIICTGDIYILGSLKGIAHAGVNGNENAIIAASHLKPTQLRIADVISRPPDEWGVEEISMEFAYLTEGAMNIDKIVHLHRIRPEALDSPLNKPTRK